MISSSIGWSTRHVIKYGNLSGSQIILLIIYATIGWFLGKQYDKAKFYSEKDILTGLYNRRFVYDKFSKLFHRSLKNSMKNSRLYKKEIGVAILYIDLDRFKLINDSLGHHIGDQILTCVSERLKVYADERDIVARIGGDEFVFVLYEAQSDQIKNKVEAILRALSTPYFLEENELYLTVSIGISQSPDHGQDINELIAKADTAMYRAKQQGKNQYQFYIEEMNADTLERLELEKHLHKAIEKMNFFYIINRG
ncbi:GGDEF domain-containing protein [Fodinisporobacter ferrooxydans]|uniref:GGDEF domain-containing protein n=2 Tax=Fodinisporobacter ferrooxydans TaxID=2901836 RepID=A0ABY4CQK0_9BACL|nr:GGDEF domain-containing protein [Alicyclobacillaceae bacterium MYW30-H2]